MKKQTNNLYVVYSLAMVNWLSADNGHRIQKVEDNEHHPNLKAFFYIDTPKLHADMIKFKKQIRS